MNPQDDSTLKQPNKAVLRNPWVVSFLVGLLLIPMGVAYQRHTERDPKRTPANAGTVLYDDIRGTQYELLIAQSDGSGANIQFSPAYAQNSTPAWGPKGQIAFASNRVSPSSGEGSYHHIWVAEPGGEAAPITNAAANDLAPSWSPDGERLVFMRGQAVQEELFVIDADGTNERQLTNGGGRYPAWSPDGTKIAFHATRGRREDIYTIEVDGTNEQRLTDDPNADILPTWDPSGARIAFVSDRSGNRDIFVMEADGSGGTAIVAAPSDETDPKFAPDGKKLVYVSLGGVSVTALDGSRFPNGATILTVGGPSYGKTVSDPSWSPDGHRIIFSSEEPGRIDIFTRVEGSQPSRPVFADVSGELSEGRSVTRSSPTWSPDRQRFAFLSNSFGRRDLWTARADGSDARRVTFRDLPSGDVSTPAWSPDGSAIAFVRSGDIFVVFLQSMFEKRITTSGGRWPTWSPDSRLLAYSSARQSSEGIYVYDMHRGTESRISAEDMVDTHPSWSPVGNSIAFEATRDGNSEIYVMDSDGTSVRRLTNSPSKDFGPAWSYDGNRLAFISTRNNIEGVFVVAPASVPSGGSPEATLLVAAGSVERIAW